MKTAVVYWSGTGNTETMAKAVAEGMTAAGAEAVLLTPDKVQPGDLNAYDAIAFGCPAMGSEVLEEMEFQPMFDACKRSLGGKRAALFGSYGWGDGEWMRSWEKDCGDAGLNLVCESVTCCDAPDDAALEACRALGKALAEGEMMPAADGNFSGRLRGLRLPNSLSEKAGAPLAVFLPCAVWRVLRKNMLKHPRQVSREALC